MSMRQCRMPFADSSHSISGVKASVINRQNIVSSSFTAKRNSSKLESYFEDLKSKRAKNLACATFFITTNVIILLFCVLSIQNIESVSAELAVTALESEYNAVYQQYVHLLFEQYFDVNFLSSFPRFRDANTKYWSMEEFDVLTRTTYQLYVSGPANVIIINSFYLDSFSMGLEGWISDGLSTRLIYHTDEEDVSYYWETDENGMNDTYPTLKYNDFYYDPTQHEKWRLMTLNNSRVINTEIFYASMSTGAVPITASMRSGTNINTGKPNVIVMSGLRHQYLQTLLNNETLSPSSRLAIVSASGSLLAVTGDDTPFDNYHGIAVTKDFTNLRDDVWQCVAKEINTRTDNFTRFCTIDGHEKPFVVFRNQFPAQYETSMSFVAVMCISELLGEVQVSSISYALIIIIFLDFVFVMGLISIHMAEKYGRNYQAKILVNPSSANEQHYSQPIREVMKDELSRFFNSHSDRPIIIKHISDTIKNLTTFQGSPYFDVTKELEHVTNKNIQNALYRRFGPFKDKIEFKLKEQKRQAHKSKNNDYYELFDNRPKLNTDNPNKILEKCVAVLIEENQRVQLFEPTGYKEGIEDLVKEVPIEMLCLLYDSLYFSKILFNELEVAIAFPEAHLVVGMCILLFHIYKEKMRKKSDLPASAFFITEKSEADVRMNAFINNILAISESRLGIFIDIASNIINGEASYSIPPALMVAKIVTQNGYKNRRFATIACSIFIYHISTISYMFAPNEETDKALTIINADINYLPCLNRSIIYVAKGIIEEITGKDFLNRLFGVTP